MEQITLHMIKFLHFIIWKMLEESISPAMHGRNVQVIIEFIETKFHSTYAWVGLVLLGHSCTECPQNI